MDDDLCNAAADRMRAELPLWGDRDYVRDRAISAYAPGFIREDHRSLIGLPAMDAREFVASFDVWFELGDGQPTLLIEDVVAVRGDRSVLVRLCIDYAGGERSGAHLLAVHFNPQIDKIERMVAFDADDLPRALARLDELSVS